VSSTEGINVARKNPLDKIAEKALSSIKDPRSTADRLYTQAKGAGSIARQVAGRVGRTAAAKAAETAGTLAERRAARRAGRHDPGLRPVPDVNEPAGPVQDFQRTEPAAAPGSAPAASGPPATPADVAKAIQKNGQPKPTSDTGPGDKLPPRKKAEPSKTAAKKSSSKKSGSAAKKSTGTSSSKKSTGSASKKSSTSTGSPKKTTGSAKKSSGGSTAKKQTPPPASDT